MNGQILITARSFRKTEGPHLQILKDAGYDLLNSPQDRPLEPAEMVELVPDVVGILLGVDVFPAEVFDHAGQLKVISRFGVGVDGVALAAATAHGVVVTNTPGANSVAVAELTLALMMALARQIPYHDRVAKQGNWNRVTGMELTGSTLGLVGLGRIGQEVARRAAGLGMRLLYYDPAPIPPELLASLGIAYRSLEDLLPESDVISLHLPLNEQTQNLIDQLALARMKPTAYLINTARGGLVDEQALCDALAGGKLAGAACDVFLHEPPKDSPLLKLDHFIASPHAGSTTLQTTLRMGLQASQNLLAVLHGERPADVVNPEVYHRL